MRIIFHTGKGGVGKTTMSAATALRAARMGYKTLVISTDPAHSLSDSLNVKLSGEPTKVTDNLWAQEVNVLDQIREHWGELQTYMSSLLITKGFENIVADELAVAPGMEELSSLFILNQHSKSNEFDLILIDCAPTGESVRLLTLPDIVDWYVNKLFSVTRTAVGIMRPLMKTSLLLPDDNVFASIERLLKQIAEVRDIVNDQEKTSIRIILNPEKMVLKESQRAFTYFNLYGYNVDAILCNKIMPESDDPYYKKWNELQDKYLKEIDESFLPIPILKNKMFETEAVGLELLDAIGREVFKDKDPTDIMFKEQLQSIKKDNDGYILSIYMPLVEKEKFALKKNNDDFIIEVGNFRKNIVLPRTLSNLEPQGASFSNGYLNIKFS
ncbi:MAG: TRC40/GET3/ArsA family transport-energizing ATPase [Candidatus Sericytochromatia bacterium]